ncbi:mandelate racemase/muconate lactonizing enzyme family protein [Aureimonas fodinaquatilis]|uniref:Mandelate racemase/muconate lactonizing enzyme family protein n=1 Tax=Aureimonas fodinaquatilis TaxID=2565783 RepID=A0A5B0DX56_9HYPH|nr:mandelate racemase/muconate lactonizing enzyme family protein [Aureimonas fodinaquatilis]KAA0970455.1 mandelate racemase/muconate lactonizing enzyme family protein [Aureimonas fodinaquatilis]
MPSIITSIEGFSLSCDLPNRVGNARVMFEKRTSLLVRVRTDDGHVGWGECWAYADAVSEMIRARLGPALIGADVTLPSAAIAPLFGFAAQDRRGLHHMAISALDIALWDAFGRVAGRPIHALLGGARRKSVQAYASGPLLREGNPYADLDEALASYVEQGFRAFKLRIGIDRQRDVAALRRARDIIGPDAMLMADMNEAGTVKEAIGLMRQIEDLELAWLEEPVPHDNFPAYVRLAQQLPVALSGGESLYGLAAFRDVLSQGGLEIVQPDLALCGGFTEARKIAALAEAFGVPTVPHVWGAGVNYLASLHFTSTLPVQRMGRFTYPLHEIDVGYNPLRECIAAIELDENGHVAVPQGPGLGVDIDVSDFEEFIVDRWTI